MAGGDHRCCPQPQEFKLSHFTPIQSDNKHTMNPYEADPAKYQQQIDTKMNLFTADIILFPPTSHPMQST
jgi:hypothetical protein